ncbi:MAG: hypothetical protein JXB32_14120 [Deltaproteobacteria bacterium]|nr:hypothetical protein [Deltaproteobacteria bacterium]
MTQEEVVGQVVDALVEAGVPYMVAGSFASNIHGVPRMTQDADIVVDLDEAGVARLVARLQGRFYVSDADALDAVRERRMFNAIHLETAFKVDLVVRKHRPFSVEELRRRAPGRLAGRTVDFATAEDTVLTKLEWARLGDSERQYADAVGIIGVQREGLEWAYLERWAANLGLSDLLQRARRGEPFRDTSP